MLEKENSRAALNGGESSNTITYNTDDVSIISKFSDEMAAYRCRRTWTEIFGNHFLLENDRDFKLSISSSGENFSLNCEFNSACGRYAFWRLINHQAPEAERKLINSGYPASDFSSGTQLPHDEIVSPWIMSGGVSEPIRRRKSFSRKLIELLWNRKN